MTTLTHQPTACIVIIEDDLRISSIFQRALKSEGFDTIPAYDGVSGMKLALQNECHLLITDIVLPKMDGLDVSKEVRKAKPELPILMLTALGTTDDKVEGFDAGADDYLVKPFEMRELMVRVRALLKRGQTYHPANHHLLTYADVELNLLTKIVKRNQVELNLTPKEFHLLTYFLQNPERVLSRVEIAEKVWNTHFDTGTNFIDVYINYLRKKLEKGFDQKLIHTKPGMGFILKNITEIHP